MCFFRPECVLYLHSDTRTNLLPEQVRLSVLKLVEMYAKSTFSLLLRNLQTRVTFVSGLFGSTSAECFGCILCQVLELLGKFRGQQQSNLGAIPLYYMSTRRHKSAV